VLRLAQRALTDLIRKHVADTILKKPIGYSRVLDSW